MDSNHGPRPYQGRALTKLSYAPTLNKKYDIPFSIVVKREKGTIPIKKSFEDNLKLSKRAHMDSNHGPRPYQGRALTKLSYAPNLAT